MRLLANTNYENIEIQATDTEGRYYVSINDKLNFEFINWEFFQEYVPSKKMQEIINEGKAKEKGWATKEEVAVRLSQQEKESKRMFSYKIITKDWDLSKIVSKYIEDNKPTYDL